MTSAKPSPDDHTLPDGWQRVRLGDVAEVVMGQSPPGEVVVDWQGEALDVDGLPFIQGNAEFGTKYPAPLKWCLQPYKVAIPGDVLISVRAPVGETNRVANQMGIGRGLAAIRFDKESQPFGWQVLNHSKSALSRVTQGSTFAAIGGGELRNLPILLPPLPEQRAIAAVLDSIDDAIEGAEAVIAATEGLRDALLHDLLTRGLPGQHTEFRDVPGLGIIPADWDVVCLGDVAEVQTGRAVNKKAVADGELKIPYLSVANVKDGYLDLRIVKTMLVSNTDVERYGLKKGDVLFTEGGDADKLGRGSVWGGEISPCLHQNHVFAVRPSADVLIPDFLSSFASSGFGKRYFLGAAKQTTNLASVNSTQLKEMTLALPNIREQRKIVGAVSAMGVSIQEATVERDNLRLLKASTAEALMTGRMRMEPIRL